MGNYSRRRLPRAKRKDLKAANRDAAIDALVRHVKRVTKGWLGKDKIRSALKVVTAGFDVGVFQVVKHYESTAETG